MAHWSSCAVNNAPALPVGPCNCGNDAPEADMSAQIIQFVPRPNPNRDAVTMEQQAIGILDYVNGLVGIPYGGAGIDGMDCSQAKTFHAPEKDPA